MSPGTLAILGVVVLATSVVGAITGGMSLVNVPVMMLLGMGARESVATNMFALTFMSLSAALLLGAALAPTVDGKGAIVGNFFTGDVVKVNLADGAVTQRANIGQKRSLSGVAQFP